MENIYKIYTIHLKYNNIFNLSSKIVAKNDSAKYNLSLVFKFKSHNFLFITFYMS